MRSFIVAAFRLFNKVIQFSHLLTSGKFLRKQELLKLSGLQKVE